MQITLNLCFLFLEFDGKNQLYTVTEYATCQAFSLGICWRKGQMHFPREQVQLYQWLGIYFFMLCDKYEWPVYQPDRIMQNI